MMQFSTLLMQLVSAKAPMELFNRQKENRMKKRAAGFVLIGSCLLLGLGGCAKDEMVKKDDGIAPAKTATDKQKVKSESGKQDKKGTDEKASMKENVSKESVRASQLQAALQKIY